MFIERLEGKWLDHPFWKTRFVLDDDYRLTALQQSRVEWVIIDADKGADLPDEAPEPVQRAAPQLDQRRNQMARPTAPLSPPTRAPAPPPTMAMLRRHSVRVQEFGKARTIARKAEKKFASMIMEAKLGAQVNVTTANEIVADVFASVERDPYAFSGLMRCKQGAPDIYRHSLIVSALMIALARKMKYSWEEARTAGQAGLLMDIGHAYLSPGIPVEQHVILGHEVLSATENLAASVVSVCLKHHERLDGSGMPGGLVEREIDELSRMAAICDAYATIEASDNLATIADPAEAINQLVNAPEKFAAEIVRLFIEAVGLYPIGSFVELQSAHVAMVVFGDPEGTDLPTVRTFYDLTTGRKVRGENIDLRCCFGRDRIVGSYDISTLDVGDLSALRERILTIALRA